MLFRYFLRMFLSGYLHFEVFHTLLQVDKRLSVRYVGIVFVQLMNFWSPLSLFSNFSWLCLWWAAWCCPTSAVARVIPGQA